jgi:hypothetical protein
MRRTALLAVPLALLLLASCAPGGTDKTVSVQQLSEPVSFYPHQTGARWEYLPDGAKIDDPRVVETVDGPAVLDGEVWIAWRLVGRGIDATRYRQYRDDGVFLRREIKLGTVITFDPPIREFPPQGDLRVGATWSGDTNVTVENPGSKSPEATKHLQVSYVYTVVDRRKVSLASGDFEVFVVSFTSRTLDAEANITNELTQQAWFAPFVGEVRDENANFLIASNVLQPPDAPGTATTP